MAERRVDFLCTGIGRGHPFYLDGIRQCLRQEQIGVDTNVVAVSRGISRLAWRAIDRAYQLGGIRGFGPLYGAARRRAAPGSGPFLTTLGRDIRRAQAARENPLVVSHALLATILRGRRNLFFQHGEVSVPPDALVTGDFTVCVPDAGAADHFRAAGQSPERIMISGLCIDPALASLATESFERRLRRVNMGTPPACGFFSSGAEPERHVTTLVTAAAVACRGGRGALFCREGGRMQREALRRFRRCGVPLAPASPEALAGGWQAGGLLCSYSSRAELDALTATVFPLLDYFVSPAHERTLWALGLGLPIFIVGPDIGTFAPLNRERLLRERVGLPLDAREAPRFGEQMLSLERAGALASMMRNGWGRYDIDGFRRIAASLACAL